MPASFNTGSTFAQFLDEPAGSYPFTIVAGGEFGVSVNATGFGSIALNTLSLDGTTWIAVLPTFTDNGFANVCLPPGQYEFVVTTASAAYMSCVRIHGNP